MSAEINQITRTKLEDFECEITEVKVKIEEEEENIDNRVPLSEKTIFQSTNHNCINSSAGSTKKRKRSKAPPGKPPYSYVALVTMAITSTAQQKMTLSEIHNFIVDNFPYYRTCPLKWKNAIRHNLTLNDCFVKLPRDSHDQNRGHYWTVDPASEMMFEDGSYRRRRRRFTRQEDLDEILPLLVERTNIPRYDEIPRLVQAIPYASRVPVIAHVSATNQPRQRGFSIDDILAPRVPAILNYLPTSPPLQIIDRRYLSNEIPTHPELYWSPPTYGYGYPTHPGRTFGYHSQ